MSDAELIPGDEFLAWARTVAVGSHPNYPASDGLTLLPPTEHRRFWVSPDNPFVWHFFCGSLVECLDRWEHGYLWPRGGRWPTPAEHGAASLRDILMRGAGVPAGRPVAVRVPQSEAAAVAAMLFTTLLFGGDTDDDVYFVPDHGRQMLMASHHDVVHVACRSEDRVRQFVADMSVLGYELPTELPDQTFKWPAWMGPER